MQAHLSRLLVVKLQTLTRSISMLWRDHSEQGSGLSLPDRHLDLPLLQVKQPLAHARWPMSEAAQVSLTS